LPERREYPSHPAVAVGAVVVCGGRVLLVQRANEPSRGRWSIPGGMVEVGETLAQAAEREVLEECGVEVSGGPVLSACDLIEHDDQKRIRFHYILVDLLMQHVSGTIKAGTDALSVAWVEEARFRDYDVLPRLLPILRATLRESPPQSNVSGTIPKEDLCP